jgi:uncharacterized protein (DUF849 family)
VAAEAQPVARATLLKACVNGRRSRADHPEVPITPDDLARDARAVVAAGAGALHVHPRLPGGRETMGPRQCAASLAALRSAVPGIPIGFTTIASIEPDPQRRVELVRRWTERPDFASVSWGEVGAPAMVSALVERDVAIEAGLWTVADAERFIESELARFCVRVLVEPMELRTAAAITTAAAIVDLVRPLGLPLVVHGYDRTTWPLLRWAVAHGHGIRIGLEDTLELEGGRRAKDNAELVRAAASLAAQVGWRS